MTGSTRTTRAFAALAATAGLLLAACGGDADDTVDRSAAAPLTALDGGDETGDGGVVGRAEADGDDAGDTAAPAGAPHAATVDAAAGSSSAAPGGEERVAPEQQVGLQAGSVDDNEEWEAYLRYREDFARLGVPVDDLPVEGRRVFTVVDADGAPVLDAEISIGETVVRTGADGRAVYLGPVDTGQQQGPAEERTVVVRHASSEVTVELAADQHQTVQIDTRRNTGVALDLLFLVDATGSMDDEIERLKANMVGVAERISELDGQPDVRFGLTSYRDDGDEYVARTVDFTSDVDRFVGSLRGVVASGGGDHPEAFNEAFAQAIDRPAWRADEGVVRLIVLVADAPPHVGRGPSYVDTVADAAAAGIRVFPVASSGTDDQAEYIFRQVAQATLGRFVFLTYGAGGAAVGETSNIDEVDYDVLSLDDLVVRLVEEELAPLR